LAGKNKTKNTVAMIMGAQKGELKKFKISEIFVPE
jgi:hypothetical protein